MGGHSSKFEITENEQNQVRNIKSGYDTGYNPLIDWCSTNKEACNAIVNQDHTTCNNAGGAFATIAALESQWKIYTDDLVKLSEQQCLDCAYTEDQGCVTASFPDNCLAYGKGVQISLNQDYPLTDMNQTCNS